MSREYTTLSEVNDLAGFFDVYATTKPEHFNSLFPNISDTDKTALNYLLTDVYGDKIILGRYEKIYKENDANFCMTRIVSACDMLFYSQWVKIQQTIKDGLNTNIQTPLTETKTISSERAGTDGNQTQDKLNAFNDIETASDTTSTETTGTHNENITTSETFTKNNGKLANENAETLINFVRENDFLNMMFNDIVEHCTISIY